MPQLKVIVNKLNKRSGPVTDFSKKANIVGTLTEGDVFKSVTEVTNNLGTWHVDKDGFVVWAGGLQSGLNVDPNTDILNYAATLRNVPANWLLAGGRDVKIAILDTGFNVDHPDLKNNIVDTFNAVDNSNNVSSNTNHGSGVAGLISAQTNTTNGIVGVAPFAKLILVKIADDHHVIKTEFVRNGLSHVIQDLDVDIINMSLSLDEDEYTLQRPQFLSLMQSADQKETLMVASAGENSGLIRQTVLVPANEESCVAIGTVDAGFLNTVPSPIFNPHLSYLVPNLSLQSCSGQSTSYAPLSDSSMAAALLSGVCALAFSSVQGRIGRQQMIGLMDDAFQSFTSQISLSNLEIFKL
jgi:subtilisin family serine protease